MNKDKREVTSSLTHLAGALLALAGTIKLAYDAFGEKSAGAFASVDVYKRQAMLKGGTISAWGAPSKVITEKSVSECFGVRVKVVDIDRERNIKGCMALME